MPQLTRRRPSNPVRRSFAIFIGLAFMVPLLCSSSLSPDFLVVGIGDSITYGTPDPDLGWLPVLVRSAQGKIEAENGGIPGARTDQMLQRVRASVGRPARLVFVMGGTNDISQGVPTRAIVANLRAILETVAGRGIPVVLLTIPPRTDPAFAAQTDALNRAIVALGASERVSVIDVYPALATADRTYRPGLTLDGLHPSPAGYETIATVIRRDLRSPTLP